MGLFSWLRNGIRQAFVQGVADGVAIVTEAATRAAETGEPIELPGDVPRALEHEKPQRRKARR